MAYSLGIDVGTTFTAAATWQDSRSTVVPLGRRSDAVPTVLCLTDAGWLVGDAAERRAVTEPDRIARTFKRRMGDDVPVRVGGRDVPVEELTAQVLGWVVERAAQDAGEPPGPVVLTHPADWGEFRTGRLRAAARSAGLAPVRLVAEPVAAASYYALRARVAPGDLIGVYDLGGGTFDASLVRKTGTGFELVGTPVGEDTGGIDLDQEILDHVVDVMGPAWHDLDPADPDTLAGLAQLRSQVVLAKEGLSDDERVEIPVLLPGLVRRLALTRDQLEQMAGPMVDRTVAGFEGLLRRSGVTPTDVAAVLLVGGSSRMPMVAVRLSEELGVRVVVDAHPKYAVCLGAATIAAASLSNQDEDDGPAEVSSTEPAPGEPRRRPSVSLIADLVRSGLAEAPAPLPSVPLGPAAHAPVVVRTGEHRSRRGAVAALLVGLVVVAIVIAVVLLRR